MIRAEPFVALFIRELAVLDVRVLDSLHRRRFTCWFDVYHGDEVSDSEPDVFRVPRGASAG